MKNILVELLCMPIKACNIQTTLRVSYLALISGLLPRAYARCCHSYIEELRFQQRTCKAAKIFVYTTFSPQ